jgi:hypothetical protein
MLTAGNNEAHRAGAHPSAERKQDALQVSPSRHQVHLRQYLNSSIGMLCIKVNKQRGPLAPQRDPRPLNVNAGERHQYRLERTVGDGKGYLVFQLDPTVRAGSIQHHGAAKRRQVSVGWIGVAQLQYQSVICRGRHVFQHFGTIVSARGLLVSVRDRHRVADRRRCRMLESPITEVGVRSGPAPDPR